MPLHRTLIGIAFVLAASSAHAAHELQVGGSAFTGTYDGTYQRAVPGRESFDGKLHGYGVAVDYAPSFRLTPRVLLGGEVGAGLYAGGGKLRNGDALTSLLFGRVGVRTQLHDDRWFVGASLGVVRFAVGKVGEGNPHPREQSGVYGSLYGGIRGDLAGLFARLEVARSIDRESRFTPIALTIGVNLAWL